jgi:hypothetical protein
VVDGFTSAKTKAIIEQKGIQFKTDKGEVAIAYKQALVLTLQVHLPVPDNCCPFIGVLFWAMKHFSWQHYFACYHQLLPVVVQRRMILAI